MFKNKLILILRITVLLMLTACGQETVVDTTAVAEQVMTGVAQTIEAMPSTTPEPTATEPPTTTETPSETPTETASPTASPTTSSTTESVAVTQANICDSAIFVSDITIPDGTKMATGTTFTKTWRVQNTGTCTWDTEYAVVFINGNRMEGTSPTYLENTVAPGETIDISIDLVAPSDVESYTGYWQIQNAAKETFGQMFYVQISVVAGTTTVTPTSTVTGITGTPTNTPVPNTETPTATPTETATEETSS